MPLDVLNPGWEASIHSFRLAASAVQQINRAVLEEAGRLEAEEEGNRAL